MQNSNTFSSPVEATQTKVHRPADHSDISTGHLEAVPRAIKHPITVFLSSPPGAHAALYRLH